MNRLEQACMEVLELGFIVLCTVATGCASAALLKLTWTYICG